MPWVGGLLAFGLAVYALVLLWKIIPLYLEVPQAKRGRHYVVSLLTCIGVMVLLSLTVSRLGHGPASDVPFAPSARTEPMRDKPDGIFADVTRQARIVGGAQQDRYTPPADGKLTAQQVQTFAQSMEQVGQRQAERRKLMEEMAAKADRDEQMTLGDFGHIMSGMAQVAGAETTEMEIVASAGGNWAEHKWVREALQTARRQREGDDAIVHNYALFLRYEDQLDAYIAP